MKRRTKDMNNIRMKDENEMKSNGENVNKIEDKKKAENKSNIYMNNNMRVRRGRKNRRIGNKVDIKAKLERSRQSARECRARKKLRYQYLEDLVVKRERANIILKNELQMFRDICKKIDSGEKPHEVIKVEEEKRKNNRRA